MLIKLNAAQVAYYRQLLSALARKGRRITSADRLKASLAARAFTPPPVKPMTFVQRDRAVLQSAAARMA